MMKIYPRQDPLMTETKQKIKILHDNYVSIFSKYELILELGKHRDTILGESSLYKYIFYSFFKDVILSITRLFENYEDNKSVTVHLLWFMKNHKQDLEDANKRGSINKQAYKNKIRDYDYYNRKVKSYYFEHKQIFEIRNRILAHSQFLYENEIKDLLKQVKSDDIKDALNLAADVIKYLIEYYKVPDLQINTEIIASAKHDIGLLTRVLEEEAESLRIQFEKYNELRSRNFWATLEEDKQD